MAIKSFICENWNSYLEKIPIENKDIYFTEEYVKLHEDSDSHSECYIFQKNDEIFLFPYLKKVVKSLDNKYFDFETAYGYGGPISNSENPDFLKIAISQMENYFVNNNFIAGFIRFHPLLKNHNYFLNTDFDVNFDRNTVSIDLNGNEKEILKNMQDKKRNSIQKAVKIGLKYYHDENFDYYDEFKKIYFLTMKKLNADIFYYFTEKYFDELRNNIKKNVFLGIVFFEDKIIAADIFLKYNEFGHYHLSGSLEEYNQYNHNNFLIYSAALQMKKQGIRLFHLGGGTNGQKDNSLFLFKKRFSQTKHDFFIGKKIFNIHAYDLACRNWSLSYPEKVDKYKNYLLKYRF